MGARRRLIAAAVLFLVFAAACGQEAVDQETGSVSELPVQETKVRKWVEYSGGKMSWEFRGEEIRYYENPERVEADSVVVDFFDEEEKYFSTLVGDFGKIDRNTGDMEVTGDVLIENREGTRLETDWLRYVSEKEIIYTDAFVTISKGRRRITGYGLETDPGLENAEIKRDIVAFTVEEPDGE